MLTKIEVQMLNCVFRLTENKTICLVLANVGTKKKFFLVYDYTIAARLKSLSHFHRYFHQKKKSAILFHFSFFSYLKGGNLLPNQRVLTNLLTRTLNETLKR